MEDYMASIHQADTNAVNGNMGWNENFSFEAGRFVPRFHEDDWADVKYEGVVVTMERHNQVYSVKLGKSGDSFRTKGSKKNPKGSKSSHSSLNLSPASPPAKHPRTAATLRHQLHPKVKEKESLPNPQTFLGETKLWMNLT
ncbi:hypothetical protein LguiB_030428 [Lonicera macranthoides]